MPLPRFSKSSCSCRSSLRTSSSFQPILWTAILVQPIILMASEMVTPLLSSAFTRSLVFLIMCLACSFDRPSTSAHRRASSMSAWGSSWMVLRSWEVLTFCPVVLWTVSTIMSFTCLMMVSCSAASLFTSVYLSMMMAISMFIMRSVITIMNVQNQKAAVTGFSSPSSSQSKSPSISRKHFAMACLNSLNSQSRRPKMNMPAMTYEKNMVRSTIMKWKSSLPAAQMVAVTTASRGWAEKDSRNFSEMKMVYKLNTRRMFMR
mmetsp:Transcript_15202/g.43469  ORF Transcript_15202/g.43469 Transcript_15202/m.43469 type:complete len:261 (-) Transcript_15202:1533-2315(-)